MTCKYIDFNQTAQTLLKPIYGRLFLMEISRNWKNEKSWQ